MVSKTITIPEIGEVSIQKSRRNKHINLRVNPSGIVTVSMPIQADYKQAEKFIREKKDWIKETIEKLKVHRREPEIIKPESDFRTRHHVLKFHTYPSESVQCKIDKGVVNIFYCEKWDIEDEFVQKCIRKSIGLALKVEARDYLPQKLEYWSRKTGLKYKRLELVDVKRSWGMCMEDDTIKLNVHLMRIPEELVDYIILHELAHIREKNHSQKYYEFLGSLLPNHRELSNRMKEYDLTQYLNNWQK